MAEYIERDKVLAKSAPVDGCFSNMISAYDVASIPAANVAPVVHGRWIDKTNPSRAIVEQRVDCSACGHIFWHTSALSYNYCPNCGAKMDGKSCVPREDGDGNG